MSSQDALSDSEWEKFRREWYQTRRMRPAAIRQAEAARRKAGEPPMTLWEAIEKHIRAQPRLRRNTLTPTSRAPEVPPQSSIEKLAAIFEVDPVLAEIGEAAALSPIERFERYGWLVDVPYDALAKLPAHMLDESYRWEIPKWALAAKYDNGARDDYYVEIVDGRMDRQHLDKIVIDRRYVAKDTTKARRALHADELGLTAEQRAHLRKLRGRLATAKQILQNVEGAATSAEHVARARAYVNSSVSAIRTARASYGLPADEPPEAATSGAISV